MLCAFPSKPLCEHSQILKLQIGGAELTVNEEIAIFYNVGAFSMLDRAESVSHHYLVGINLTEDLRKYFYEPNEEEKVCVMFFFHNL